MRWISRRSAKGASDSGGKVENYEVTFWFCEKKKGPPSVRVLQDTKEVVGEESPRVLKKGARKGKKGFEGKCFK